MSIDCTCEWLETVSREMRDFLLERGPYSLAAQADTAALQEHLSSFAFVKAKLDAFGTDSLIADFDLLLAGAASAERLDARERAGLAAVQDALRVAADIITREPGQLAAQLIGRLAGEESLSARTLLTGASETQGAPWLRPLIASLTTPGTPVRSILGGHDGMVLALALTPDGRHAITGGQDATVRLWDLRSGTLVRTLRGHGAHVSAVVGLPGGLQCLSAGEDALLILWDLESGQALHRFAGHTEMINAVAVSPDGKWAASGAGQASLVDGTVKVWNLETGSELWTLRGHADRVTAVAAVPDSVRLVSASEDGTLHVWNARTGATLQVLEGHVQRIMALKVVSVGGRAVAISTGQDRTVKGWDLDGGRLLFTRMGHTWPLECLVVTPDAEAVIAGTANGLLVRLSLSTEAEPREVSAHGDGVAGVAITPDGRFIVSAGLDGTIKIWDHQAIGQTTHRQCHSNPVSAIAIAPDGRRAVTAARPAYQIGPDERLIVWDVAGPQEAYTVEGLNGVAAVAVTPDGERFVAPCQNHALGVWELTTGHAILALTGHTSRINSVVVTADGRFAVSAAGSTVGIWDLRAGIQRALLTGHTGSVNRVAVTRDGRTALSVSDDGCLRLWELPTSAELAILQTGQRGIKHLVVTPDGRYALTATEHILQTAASDGPLPPPRDVADRTIQVWDLQRGVQYGLLTGHQAPVTVLAMSPDGRYAFSGSDDHSVRVWSIQRQAEVHALPIHAASVSVVAVAPDGQFAVSGGRDRTIKAWDTGTGEVIGSFTVDSPVSACAIAPDGKTVIAGDRSGAVHFLRLEHLSAARC